MLSKVTHNAVPSCPQARTVNNSTELPRALGFSLWSQGITQRRMTKASICQMFFFNAHIQYVPKLKALVIFYTHV